MIIPERDANGNIINNRPAFAEKEYKGKSLYKRVHGKKYAIPAGTTKCFFEVPYDHCKITGIEIVNAGTGDTANFKVIDSDSGLISGVANYMLNQFGFDVNLKEAFHREENEYDADLYKTMKLELEITTTLAKTIGINFILHEVK